jgi:multidrug efflux system membrane fusion protein
MDSKLFSLLALVLISAACSGRYQKPVPREQIRVRVTKVIEDSISLPVHTSGILVSSAEMKLSFKTGGIVEKIFVREGDRVKKGDILASLNLSEITASAEQARNVYDKTLRDLKRVENLFRDSAATLEQRQNAETAFNVAKSNYDIVQFNLQHSRIVAPANGVIMKQFFKENELVSSGYPIFLFGTTGKYWKLEAGLADREIIRVNKGDSAAVVFDAYPGVRFSAMVDQVGEISNPYTGTYETDLILKDSGVRLVSGFVGSADIYPRKKNPFVMVPIGSLLEADGHHGYVYIVTSGMKAGKVRVEISAVIGAMAAVSGLPQGISEVVSEGAAFLRDGADVEIVRQ